MYHINNSKTFWDNVKKTNTCWTWLKSDRNGYGAFSYKNKSCSAHRMAWFFTFGDIPKGLLVCHKCDNKKCVNPDHLFLGTPLDNMRDMIKKGRAIHSVRTQFKKGLIPKNRKFTIDQIKNIRKRYVKGKITMKTIANEYKVDKSAIWLILHNKTYFNQL